MLILIKVHNWNKLEAATEMMQGDDAERTQARIDLAELLEMIKAAPELEQYFKTRKSNRSASITTFETMWTLFSPKTEIVARPFLDTPQAFVVSTAPIPYDPKVASLSVVCWCWDWNGKEMVQVYHHLRIEAFRGTKDISSLPCYPIKYYKDEAFENETGLPKALSLRGAR